MNHVEPKPAANEIRPRSRHTLTPPIPARLLTVLLLSILSVPPLHAEERTAIQRIPPIYPPMAKQLHITGSVKVIATVDAAGAVVKAESDSGNKMLAPSAIDAVKRWKFTTGPGTATVIVVVTFDM
jgi:TonB family protein